MKYLALCIVLLSTGCNHAIDRAKNAGDNIDYAAALDQCYADAAKEWPAAGAAKVQADYEACAAGVDSKFGVK